MVDIFTPGYTAVKRVTHSWSHIHSNIMHIKYWLWQPNYSICSTYTVLCIFYNLMLIHNSKNMDFVVILFLSAQSAFVEVKDKILRIDTCGATA